ncbi:HEAT repeat domain-containing protein [Maribacter sp. CXY002]|uniref:HEAT repeat domain-containing protein n=1 Tax=Maribacter luteocoastalis TaxID=3407671 RepID=UPI003B67CEF7
MIKVPQTYITHLVTAPKISTDLLWGLSILFVVLTLIYVFSVFYFRNKISNEAEKIREKKMELSPIISEFLFYDEKGDKIEKINYIGLKIQVRELIKNTFDRKVLTEILMDLRKDVSGATRTELFHIYQDLELHKDAYKKLKSLRWEIVSKGIYELTQMHVEESYGYITKFINDKRPTIRKQAEIATVTLKEEGIAFFLDHTKFKISEWQQLKLLDVVRNIEDLQPPSFRLWLTSKNNHVVLFSLRLIKYFNQNDASASLIQLLNHKNHTIKREAITCIKEFNVKEAIPELKQIFGPCNTDSKLFILDAISTLGNESDLEFLKQVEKTDRDFTVRNKAVRAINTICPESILPTKDIVPTIAEIEDINANDSSGTSIEHLENIEYHSLQSDIKRDNTLGVHSSSELESIGQEVDDEPDTITKDTIDLEDINVLADEVLIDEQDIELPVELSIEDIGFLPIVTDSITAGNGQTTEVDDETFGNVPNSDHDTKGKIEVETKEWNGALNLNFLPIIVGEEVLTNTIEDLEVIHETIIVAPSEDIDINELEVIYEIVRAANPVLNVTDRVDDQTNIFTKDNIDLNVHKLEVNYEEISCNEEAKEETEIFLDWTLFSDLEESEPLEITTSKVEIETTIEKSVKIPETTKDITIPKAIFFEDDVLEKLVLLEDISDLGDHREIPLLKLMLLDEKSNPVKQRINDLIQRFTVNFDGVTYFKITDLEPSYSVFQELFEKSDFESKILLLDEIAQIGDEKELPLLNELVNGNNKIIAKKAAMVTTALHKRLAAIQAASGMISGNGNSSGSFAIHESEETLFEIDFEPGKPSLTNTIKNKDNPTYGSTLFDHLVGASSKLYNKFNK